MYCDFILVCWKGSEHSTVPAVINADGELLIEKEKTVVRPNKLRLFQYSPIGNTNLLL